MLTTGYCEKNCENGLSQKSRHDAYHTYIPHHTHSEADTINQLETDQNYVKLMLYTKTCDDGSYEMQSKTLIPHLASSEKAQVSKLVPCQFVAADMIHATGQ